MLTQDQIEQAKATMTGNNPSSPITPEQAKASFNSQPFKTQSTSQTVHTAFGAVNPNDTTPIPQITKDIGNIPSSIGGTFQQGAQGVMSDIGNVKKNAEAAGGGVGAYALSGLQAAGHVAGDVARTAGGLIGDVISPLIPKKVKEGVSNIASTIDQKVAALPGMTPELHKSIGDVLNTALLEGGAKGAPVAEQGVKSAVEASKPIVEQAGQAISKGAETVQQGASDLATKVKNAVTSTPEELVAQSDQKILDAYNKGIKPTIAGKKTIGAVDKYNQGAVDAVKTITQNKDKLNITNEYGDPTGKLPENPKQFSQAIDQTKQQIFNQYDSLAKQAGESGAKVELTPAVNELNKLASDKVVNDLHPELASYAKARANALTERGSYTTSEAQTAVQNLNRSLDSFYKNPSYETASKASVDAMIANNLRTGLDSAITDAKGAGYAELKAKYGNLKSIEADVNKKAQLQARKTAGGLSFGDVFSAEEVMRGLSSMNPVAIATGAGLKGVTQYFKYLNSPDRFIKNMFKEADNTIGTTHSAP